MEKSQTSEVEYVSLQLRGVDADRFRDYKRREIIDQNSVAAKKLMFERLAQIERKSEEAA